MAFGYIGPEPTNDETANGGLFTINEINELVEDGKFSPDAFSCDFLLVGGGGSGGPGNVCGGGGGGGVISSVDTNGGGTTTPDSALTLVPGVEYEVRVGSGASNNEYTGRPTIFHTKKALGGGSGWRSNRSIDAAVGGGGGYAPFGWTNYGHPTLSQLSDDEKIALTGSASKQGYRGSNTGYESYNSAGGGGGAGQNGSTTNTGSNGTAHAIQSSTNQSSSGIGEWHNNQAKQYVGAGGGSGANSGTSGGYGGGGNGGQNSGNAGDANTGGGGGGRMSASGYSGGSGAILLKYPDTYTCTAGTGVTGAEYDEGTGYKTFGITAGAGTITFSKA